MKNIGKCCVIWTEFIQIKCSRNISSRNYNFPFNNNRSPCRKILNVFFYNEIGLQPRYSIKILCKLEFMFLARTYIENYWMNRWCGLIKYKGHSQYASRCFSVNLLSYKFRIKLYMISNFFFYISLIHLTLCPKTIKLVQPDGFSQRKLTAIHLGLTTSQLNLIGMNPVVYALGKFGALSRIFVWEAENCIGGIPIRWYVRSYS